MGVRVDPLYNDRINHAYQARLLHSAIQKARKTMGLRPWNNVTVMIDNRFIEAASGDVIGGLTRSLPSDTTLLLKASFDPLDLANYTVGETMNVKGSKVYVDRFTWNLVDTAGAADADDVSDSLKIEGYFCLHFKE